MGEHLGENFLAVSIGVYYNRPLYYKSIKLKILLCGGWGGWVGWGGGGVGVGGGVGGGGWGWGRGFGVWWVGGVGEGVRGLM